MLTGVKNKSSFTIVFSTHRRRGLNGKELQLNIATSNIVSVALQLEDGVSVISHEALCSPPATAGLTLLAEKSFPVVK